MHVRQYTTRHADNGTGLNILFRLIGARWPALPLWYRSRRDSATLHREPIRLALAMNVRTSVSERSDVFQTSWKFEWEDSMVEEFIKLSKPTKILKILAAEDLGDESCEGAWFRKSRLFSRALKAWRMVNIVELECHHRYKIRKKARRVRMIVNSILKVLFAFIVRDIN